MNERIKEIKESSRPEIDWEARHYAELNNGEKEKWMDEWFGKFAELIVRECAKSLWTEECHTSDLAVEEYNRNSKKIKQHFGVKS